MFRITVSTPRRADNGAGLVIAESAYEVETLDEVRAWLAVDDFELGDVVTHPDGTTIVVERGQDG